MGGQTPGSLAVADTIGEALTGGRANPTNFLAADAVAKYALLQDLMKSYDLAPSGSLELFKVTEEEVAITEVGRVPLSSHIFFSMPCSLPFMLVSLADSSESYHRFFPG